MISPRYKFADFVLDVREEMLCKNGEPLNLKNRTFRVLQCLVENAGKIVTKEEFFERVWQGAVVEDNNLTVAVAQIRKVLEETKENKFIETVSKKGYRFTAEVERVFDANTLANSEKIPANLTNNRENLAEQPAANTKQNISDVISSRKILVFAAFSENDKAIEWLAKGIEAHVPDILSIKYAPAFDKLRGSGNFQKIIERMNFPR